MKLKTDFHLHSKEDPHDVISYTARELIDHLASRGYNAISLTFHDAPGYTQELADYAKEKGITLLPGVERTIEGAHILLLNVTNEEISQVHTLEDLKKIKREDTLIIPSHPFFFLNALGKRLEKNLDVIDGIEYCHFYLPFLNLNKKSVALSKKYKKPLIGNSDSHYLFQAGHTYSIVDAEKNTIPAIIKAIKQGNVEVVTKPLDFLSFFKVSFALFILMPFKIWKRGGHY